MEPIGAIASAITLVDAISKTSNAVKKLTRRFKNAPQELESLETMLNLMRVCLQQMQHVNHDFGSGVSAHIDTALRSANSIVASLDRACERQHLRSNTGSRLSWALVDESRMQGQMAQLREVQSTLQDLFHMIGL